MAAAQLPVHPTPRPDHQEDARRVGLRYVTDSQPGIRRLQHGRGFRYEREDDRRPVRDAATLARIRSLAIPPAWTGVWICEDEQGHIQATGRDARGRKQYRYHPRWHAVRDETKYGRMLAFGFALPQIRSRVERDLRRRELDRIRVAATVVRLLEATLMRVGNREYAARNGSHGLTTLQDHHVEVGARRVRFSYRGKSGRWREATLDDPRLARLVKRCRDLPGQDLFQYLGPHGEQATLGSGDVNDYLREIAGEPFTAKDFRTWAGSVLALEALLACEPPSSAREARRQVVRAVDAVAAELGNTRAVCRRSYIHPDVLRRHEERMLHALVHETPPPRPPGKHLDAGEAALLALLQACGRG